MLGGIGCQAIVVICQSSEDILIGIAFVMIAVL